MRYVGSLVFLFLLAFNAKAEVPIYPTACSGGITHVTLYRCVCRLDVPNAVGGGQSSIPIAMNGQLTIFSRTELSGACQGTVSPNACNPIALNGANAVGTYSCISVTTTDTGVRVNW